jgi:AbrB family looped-hinge helix DNA binding protein
MLARETGVSRNGIYRWFHPLYNAIMKNTVCVDQAGRIVLPKPLRDKMQLAPGDQLLIESECERITLRPVRPRATMKKEYGIWVYQGEPSATSIPELIERERENRGRELSD